MHMTHAQFIQEAKRFQDVMANLNKDITPKLTRASLTALISQAEELNHQLANVKTSVSRLRIERNQKLDFLNQFMVNVRAQVKLDYGDDSVEYGAFGGTRASERKRRPRKSKKLNLPATGAAGTAGTSGNPS